ncbi:uncharacterized protein SPPG_08366 [Spizellomyces punctatus DAOM BR117]|uniref:Uncharacterized protein n=1 Tax=Spizellomyces punctatus (strain DAOM BR117) TaxID=645134 RepID=A0A0L0H673_SPIPD|nr:uncharacterized protein SPPG_08366 [Spizellomyces punctatus DAOM BR117]KNC96213.1 hypothetical protein SPPG_08366 [Spizellomyces punctatus DAOM BR117]|eukprot:XP_016604253.1 hypothetical protein SPPG_08366 [Spizellomyces punctatus DAOM BR117]
MPVTQPGRIASLVARFESQPVGGGLPPLPGEWEKERKDEKPSRRERTQVTPQQHTMTFNHPSAIPARQSSRPTTTNVRTSTSRSSVTSHKQLPLHLPPLPTGPLTSLPVHLPPLQHHPLFRKASSTPRESSPLPPIQPISKMKPPPGLEETIAKNMSGQMLLKDGKTTMRQLFANERRAKKNSLDPFWTQ